MGIVSSLGNIKNVLVKHNGVVKEVQSGWINQNGIAVPFYKKGGQLPFDSITVSKSTYFEIWAEDYRKWHILFDNFDISNVREISVVGKISSYHSSPYVTGTTFGDLYLVSADREFTDISVTRVNVSGKSTSSVNINKTLDVSTLKGNVYFGICNDTQSKKYAYDITFTCYK